MKILVELYDHRYNLFNYPDWCLGEIKALAHEHEVINILSDEQLEEHLPDAEVYFGWSLSEDKFKKANNLKWIHSASAEVTRQLYPVFVDSDVTLTMSRGTRASAIAEHALGMMLYFARQFHILIRSQMRAAWARGAAWDHFPFFKELDGSTVGIIGLGRIGLELSKKCHALGMRVIATSKKEKHSTYDFVDFLGGTDEINVVLQESDFVVNCVPVTGDDEYIIGYNELKLMKKDSYFINVGRGSAVNENELVEALMDKLIAGAALDSFEREPLPDDSYLWRLEGTLITPKISGISPRFMARTHEAFLDNLRHYLSNETLEYIIRKRVECHPQDSDNEN